MNKKTNKILFILAIIILFSAIYITTSNAADLSWNSISGSANNFINKGKDGANYIDDQSMADLVTGIGSILTTIGVVIVVVGFLVMGIQYMMATPEEAAKLKTKLVGLTVAGVVILGAWGIWKLTLTFLSGITA